MSIEISANRRRFNSGKFTIAPRVMIFDMDHTLVSVYTDEPFRKLPTEYERIINLPDDPLITRIIVRNGVTKLLESCATNYDYVYIFTAGFPDYAAHVINIAGLSHYFDGIFSSSHTTYIDGTGYCRDGMHKCLSRLCTKDGIPLTECIVTMVDDTIPAINNTNTDNFLVCEISAYDAVNKRSGTPNFTGLRTNIISREEFRYRKYLRIKPSVPDRSESSQSESVQSESVQSEPIQSER